MMRNNKLINMNFGKKINQVKDFNQSFKFRVEENPCFIPENEYRLNHSMMKEENDEYLEACENNDLVEIADALGDQLYILCGKILKHGMQHKIDEVFSEIHLSNMSKLENGKIIKNEEGKVVKGKSYFKPNIKKILEK